MSRRMTLDDFHEHYDRSSQNAHVALFTIYLLACALWLGLHARKQQVFDFAERTTSIHALCGKSGKRMKGKNRTQNKVQIRKKDISEYHILAYMIFRRTTGVSKVSSDLHA